jgi:LPS-assembly lipoprotein
METKLNKYRFFLSASFLFLASCGFHLRGMVDMPAWLNDVSIVIQNAEHQLGPLLIKHLEAYSIRICANPARAKYWLIVEEDHFSQDITSVSSSTTPRQYQLTYRVRFKLQQANGPEIIPSRTVIVTRQLTVNSNRILGSNAEEGLFQEEMRRDAVLQVIDRIVSAKQPIS